MTSVYQGYVAAFNSRLALGTRLGHYRWSEHTWKFGFRSYLDEVVLQHGNNIYCITPSGLTLVRLNFIGFIIFCYFFCKHFVFIWLQNDFWLFKQASCDLYLDFSSYFKFNGTTEQEILIWVLPPNIRNQQTLGICCSTKGAANSDFYYPAGYQICRIFKKNPARYRIFYKFEYLTYNIYY
jgi:hypothetical protein